MPVNDIYQTGDLIARRYERVKELGLCCYNQFADGTAPFLPEALEPVNSLLTRLNEAVGGIAVGESIESLQTRLEYAVIALGCACYNLYLDKQLPKNHIYDLCRQIESLNRKIDGESTDDTFVPPKTDVRAAPRRETGQGNDADFFGIAAGQEDTLVIPSETNVWTPFGVGAQMPGPTPRYSENAVRNAGDGLPAGMEYIPTDFRRCLCGYRNRSWARYCGKCGEELL